MEYILTILFTLIIVITLYYFFVLKKKNNDASDNLYINQQLESIRNEFRTTLNNTSSKITTDVKNITDGVNNTLNLLNNSLNSNINNQNTSLNQKLENVSKLVNQTSVQFGEMKRFADEIKQTQQDFVSFTEIFKAPKLRGGIGELMLEDLLRQVLPASIWQTQYEFKNNTKVDAIIKTSQGILTIDSKFPYENFKKMLESENEKEKTDFGKLFTKDVKVHIDSISKKYILTDEGTYDFAFMYIPAENIYYETIIKNNKDEQSLNDYAIERKVIPVSPNTFYAHLKIIVLGFKGQQVESKYKDFIANLDRLSRDLKNFEEEFDLLGKHLTNAQKTFDRSAKQLDKFENKLQITTGIEIDENKQIETNF